MPPPSLLPSVSHSISIKHVIQSKYYNTRGALRALTSSWRPFGPLHFVLRALRALRPVGQTRLRSGPPFLTILIILGNFRPF